MYNTIITLDGPDKTGKDTIRDLLVKRSNGSYLVYVRSFISQIVYSRIYKKNIDEGFFWERFKHQYDLGELFFNLICNIDVVKERFIKHDEKDLLIEDYNKHLMVFLDIVEEAYAKGINIYIIDTSDNDKEKTYIDIQQIIIENKLDNCQKCSLHSNRCNIRDFNKGYGKLLPNIISNDIEYLFVGMNPSKNRVPESKNPFVVNKHNYKNKTFNQILIDLNIYEKSMFTNLVKCSTESNAINKQNVDDCNFHLKNEIELFKPKKIIALGNVVYNFLQQLDFINKDILTNIYHPAYQYAYNKISKEQYYQHIKKQLI